MLSDSEFLALPDALGKRELLNGELIDLPPAKRYHSIIARMLINLLKTVMDETRIWHEDACHLGDGKWLIPDVSVSWPDQPVEDGWHKNSPMLAIEIAFRGNSAEELESKTALYLEYGAAEVWILYPKTKTMVASRRDSVQRIVDGEAYHCELLDLTVETRSWIPVQ